MAWLRRLFAALVLLAFTACFIRAVPSDSALYLVERLQFVPALTGVISGRAWAWASLALLVLLTLLFGRVYCSWICPLGMMQDLANRLVRPRPQKLKGAAALHTPNHGRIRLIFGLLGFGSLLFCGTLLLTWLDPYSIAARFMTAVVNPAAASIGLSDGSADRLRYGPWLLVIVLISIGIPLLMALLRGRLYCNSICPVGALHGLISRIAPFTPHIDEKNCRLCGHCLRACKAHAIDLKTLRIDATRCIACYNCLESCDSFALSLHPHNPFDTAPRKAQGMRRSKTESRPRPNAAPPASEAPAASAAPAAPAAVLGAAAEPSRDAAPSCASALSARTAAEPTAADAPAAAPAQTSAAAETSAPRDVVDLSRRAFLGYGLFTVAAAALPSVSAASASAETTATGSNIGPAPLPPGAGDLDRFLDTCTACGLCISACPSHVLRPSYTSLGWKGLMKPYLDYSVGFCQPDCHSCSQVCPTGALLPLSLAEKKATQIGIVDFRQEHCIVWHQDRDCCDCADACPTGAIEAVEVKRPVVDPNKCTGCRGKRCFNACPTGSISYTIREDTGRRLAVVNYDTCIGCGYCAEACSKRHAIDVSVHRAPKLHPERCTGCGACTHVCPASPAKAMRVHPRIRHLQLLQSDATA